MHNSSLFIYQCFCNHGSHHLQNYKNRAFFLLKVAFQHINLSAKLVNIQPHSRAFSLYTAHIVFTICNQRSVYLICRTSRPRLKCGVARPSGIKNFEAVTMEYSLSLDASLVDSETPFFEVILANQLEALLSPSLYIGLLCEQVPVLVVTNEQV